MKKITAIVAGLMLIPFTAFGMQTISEQEMDNVTGQSGVAIAIDDVMVHFSASETWYQNVALDPDGASTDNAAAVGMVESGEELMFVNAIVGMNIADDNYDGLYSSGEQALLGAYDDLDLLYSRATTDGAETEGEYDHSPSALTIRVSDDLAIFNEAADYTGEGTGQVAGVQISLPTVEIHTEGSMAMDLLVSVTELADPSPVGNTREDANTWSYGTLYSGSETMAVLGGTLVIAPLEAYAEGLQD